MDDARNKTAKLLEALWVRNRPLVEARLALLDRARQAAAAGVLDDGLRLEAVGGAHKLAGSLGMYGYDEGTRIAREVEVLLDGASCDAARLCGLIAELRAALSPATGVDSAPVGSA